jgi:hypothetical protein
MMVCEDIPAPSGDAKELAEEIRRFAGEEDWEFNDGTPVYIQGWADKVESLPQAGQQECERYRELETVMLKVAEEVQDCAAAYKLGLALGETGCECGDGQSCPTCEAHPGAKGDPSVVLVGVDIITADSRPVPPADQSDELREIVREMQRKGPKIGHVSHALDVDGWADRLSRIADKGECERCRDGWPSCDVCACELDGTGATCDDCLPDSRPVEVAEVWLSAPQKANVDLSQVVVSVGSGAKHGYESVRRIIHGAQAGEAGEETLPTKARIEADGEWTEVIPWPQIEEGECIKDLSEKLEKTTYMHRNACNAFKHWQGRAKRYLRACKRMHQEWRWASDRRDGPNRSQAGLLTDLVASRERIEVLEGDMHALAGTITYLNDRLARANFRVGELEAEAEIAGMDLDKAKRRIEELESRPRRPDKPQEDGDVCNACANGPCGGLYAQGCVHDLRAEVERLKHLHEHASMARDDFKLHFEAEQADNRRLRLVIGGVLEDEISDELFERLRTALDQPQEMERKSTITPDDVADCIDHGAAGVEYMRTGRDPDPAPSALEGARAQYIKSLAIVLNSDDWAIAMSSIARLLIEHLESENTTPDALQVILTEMRASGETMVRYWAGRIEGVMK